MQNFYSMRKHLVFHFLGIKYKITKTVKFFKNPGATKAKLLRGLLLAGQLPLTGVQL